jgi:3',5'-nucleoside bisphosphate phosphatase
MIAEKTDLHMHSYHSDGYHSPEKVVEKAKNQGIKILSITDHDSVNAFSEATEYAKKFGIEVIPGVEISTDIRDTEVHILGYFVDPQNKDLEHYLNFFREERIKRAIRMVKKLNILGLDITIDDVLVSLKIQLSADHISLKHCLLKVRLNLSSKHSINISATMPPLTNVKFTFHLKAHSK